MTVIARSPPEADDEAIQNRRKYDKSAKIFKIFRHEGGGSSIVYYRERNNEQNAKILKISI